MEPLEFISFLGKVEKLKSNTRHSITSDSVPETVAAHSWRMAMMALLLKEQLKDVDMQKVLHMCIIHDIGEAVTGDIPSFDKTQENEEVEKKAIRKLLEELPEDLCKEFTALFDEMDALETKEAKVYKALDRMEAVLQHNEAPISSWLPLEYELQMTYGVEDAKVDPWLTALREQLKKDTLQKIEKNS